MKQAEESKKNIGNKEISYIGVSKLISNEECVAERNKASLLQRHTGATTGRLLEVIGQAMQASGDYSKLVFGLDPLAEHVIDMLRSLIEQLDLKYLEVEVTKNAVHLRYNILRGQYSLQEQQEIDHEAEKI